MKIRYDYFEDTLSVNRKEYCLAQYREYLLKYHEELCLPLMLRSKYIGSGYYKRTFAWETIYYKAKLKGIIFDFLNNQP